jgi:hypothetical protein
LANYGTGTCSDGGTIGSSGWIPQVYFGTAATRAAGTTGVPYGAIYIQYV